MSLPEQLREEAARDRRTSGSPEREAALMREAADEIERLRERVRYMDEWAEVLEQANPNGKLSVATIANALRNGRVAT